MSAAGDAEVLEALIRSEMARVAAYKPAADRGSYDAKNARTWLFRRLDGLFDDHGLLLLRAQVEAIEAKRIEVRTIPRDEQCEGA